MKRTKYILMSALMCMTVIMGWAQEPSRLSFGVISDIHFGSNTGEGAMVKVPKALKNISSYGTLDALAIVGDLTDGGRAGQYDQLVQVFADSANFTNPVGELLFMMGNHDHYDSNGVSYYQNRLKGFNGGETYPLHSYRVIKGYPFVTLSLGTSSSYPAATVEWLDENLATAASECPGRPIFVFTHIPPANTCYATWAKWENGVVWSSGALNAVLDKYPQAVVFSGHSHYPIGDPRSIHQGVTAASDRNNYYTVINTGSTNYSEIHPGAVDKGIHPENYENITEGLIVTELENGNIEVRRFDTYSNEEIGASNRWVLEAPFDGSKFKYADIRDADENPDSCYLRNGLPAPLFAEGAELAVEPGAYNVTVTIPQAVDDECVFRYEIRAIKEGANVVVARSSVFSQFYLNSAMPDTLSCTLEGLDPKQNYKLEVVAYDSYDNASEPVAADFSTVADDDPANDVPAPFNRWAFDNDENILASDIGGVAIETVTFDGGNVTACDDVAAAGVELLNGPSLDNKAVMLPCNVGLKASLNLDNDTKNYTLQMDVRVKDAKSYNALIQTNLANSDDADCFFYGNSIGVGAMGYGGTIESNTWYRVLFVNSDGNLSVYVDGKLINSVSKERWTINKEGILLFVDNDGERVETEVAEVAFWDKPLTVGQIRRLGRVAVDEFVTILTPNVRLVDNTDFSITVNTNTAIKFVLPEWIKAVDIVPALGSKKYTFSAEPMAEPGRRKGVIMVESGNLPSQEIPVTQILLGSGMPEASGVWTFDNPDDLMAGTGTSTIRPATRISGDIQVVGSADEAGIVSLEEGPSSANGAIGLPVSSYLWMSTDAECGNLSDYTLMFDVRPEKLDGFNSLFRNSTDDSCDGSLFIKNGQVGINVGGLGYNGALELGKWHRIVAVVRELYMHVYVDGVKVGESSSPNERVFMLHPESVLFGDNDGEEAWNDIAEIRFWDVPLSDSLVSELGGVAQGTVTPDPLLDPVSVWTFDNADNLLHTDGVASITGAVRGDDGTPQDADGLTAAGLVAATGPMEGNGALTVPVNSYLRINHNQSEAQQKTFSIMMDVRPRQALSGFISLYQADVTNQSDASLFIKNNQVGINFGGVGYKGELEQGKWHRILFVVEECSLSLYLDGMLISSSTKPSAAKWSLNEGSFFFADNDGDEKDIDVAELRYWNDALTSSMVKQLGSAYDVPTGIESIKPSDAKAGGIYDLKGRKMDADKLQKGIYIVDGEKRIVK